MEINDLLKDTNPKDIKKLIALLQSISDAQESDDVETEHSTAVSNSSPVKKENKRPKTDRVFKNKFLDMPEHRMHKEDSIIDKKLITQPPVVRERYFEPVSVTCRICHKTESLSPNLVDNVSRYKCNKCSTNPG